MNCKLSNADLSCCKAAVRNIYAWERRWRYNNNNIIRALIPKRLGSANMNHHLEQSLARDEGGDRVYNFLDQSSLSQDQRHTHFVETNWVGFQNKARGANERKFSAPLSTGAKNYNDQRPEIKEGNNQLSRSSHELKFSHSSPRQEIVKNPSQVQQLNVNGYMHAHEVVNVIQNEANFLSADRGSDRHNMTSRSFQQHSNSASFGGAEAPMNFSFNSGQHQMPSQQRGMLQSLPLQQSGINDAQLLQQQQRIIQQMRELQRRQQFQQVDAMQNSMNHMSAFPNQPAREQSQSVNANPMQNASNYPWQSQVNAGGTNWQLGRHPSAINSYSNELIGTHGQSQASQSLYGVPVNSGGANPFSLNSMDKQGIFLTSAPSRSFSGYSYTPNGEQVNIPDPCTGSRSGFEGITSSEHASSQGLENAGNLGGFNQVRQSKMSLAGGSDVSPANSLMRSSASQSITSETTAGLDPTEEKILFGNDVNIWEAFGEASITENDRADLFNKVPSLQSGTWSALMHSAVAETSCSDVKTHEEWSGLESQNSKTNTGFWSNRQSNEAVPHPNLNSKVGSCSPGLNNVNSSYESSQRRHPDNHSLDQWKQANFATKSGIFASGTYQSNMNTGQSVVNSSVVSPRSGVSEMVWTENGDGKRNYNDSYYEAQPTVVGPSTSSMSDLEKGRLSGFHGGIKMPRGGFPGSAHPGYLPSTLASFARSGENSSANQRVSSSQTMLELLHKVDHSDDQNDVSSMGPLSVNYNRSDIPVAGPSEGQSSTSREFNLQLAPPSQRIVLSSLNDPAQSSLRSVGSLCSQIESTQNGDKSIAWLAPEPSGQGRSSQMDSGNDKCGGLGGAASMASNSTYLRNSFQNQHMTAAGAQMMNNYPSSFVSSDEHAYCAQQSINSQNHAIASQSVSNLSNNFASNLSGISTTKHQMSTSLKAELDEMKKDNMLSAAQQNLGIQARNSSDFMKSHFQSNDASDMNLICQVKKHELDGPRSTNAARVYGGEERAVASPLSSGINTHVSQEESLGRQSNQAMKNMDMDPNHQEAKRFRDLKNGRNPPKMAENAADPFSDNRNSMDRDPSGSRVFLSSGDNTHRFSPQSGNRAPNSQDKITMDCSVSQALTGRAQFAGISPQMAPTWSEEYGTFRNGQMLPQLPVHNVPGVPVVQNVEQLKPPNNLGVQNKIQLENAVTDSYQIANANQIKNVYTASEHISSLRTPLFDDSPKNPVAMRPKKRKTATSDPIPWNKEITEGLKRTQNTSSSEADWAQSSNRLVERGGDGIDFHQDMSPMIKPRRRLILTTKLMQQVFRPPSASVLSLDGRTNGEVILYSIARLALGDACNLICDVKSPVDNGNFPSAKDKISEERIRDQYFLKVVEDFTNRAKDLENDLLRLDKHASSLDLRLDSQEVEKLSIINRFARFYTPVQVKMETSSSSDGNAAPREPFPKRYITARPMPNTVPQTVQCLTIN